MSIDSDMQDMVDSVTAFVDELPENQEALNTNINSIENFLSIDDDLKDRNSIIYPYRKTTQPTYRGYKLVVDRNLSKVFPLIKDIINSTYITGKQENTLGKNMENRLESIRDLQQQGLPTTNLSLVPEQQGIFSNFMDKLKGLAGKSDVESLIENPWQASQNILFETMNIPNVWKKSVIAHSTGVLRAKVFHIDMESWRGGELWYLESHVEPEIMKMINASDEITRTFELRHIANVLTKFYEQKEREMAMQGFQR